MIVHKDGESPNKCLSGSLYSKVKIYKRKGKFAKLKPSQEGELAKTRHQETHSNDLKGLTGGAE